MFPGHDIEARSKVRNDSLWVLPQDENVTSSLGQSSLYPNNPMFHENVPSSWGKSYLYPNIPHDRTQKTLH